MHRRFATAAAAVLVAVASAVAFACGGDDVIVPLERDAGDASIDATIANDGSVVATSDAGADALDASFDGTLPPRCLPDTLDQSFGEGGIVVLPVMDSVAAIAHQSDGKLVALGTNAQGMVLARLLADGTLDPAFGNGGVTALTAGEGALAMTVASDDVIVIVGTKGTLARFSPDGSPDSAFADGGTTNAVAPPTGLAMDGLNRVLVAGSVSGRTWISRYDSLGGFDPGFGEGGTVNLRAPCFMQPDSVLVATTADAAIFVEDFGQCFDGFLNELTVLSTNGTIAFQAPTETHGFVFPSAIIADHEGRAVIVARDGLQVERILGDAARDITFGKDGVATLGPGAAFYSGTNVEITPDGDVVVIGGASSCPAQEPCGLVVAAFAHDGALVPSFGDGGALLVPVPNASVPAGASLRGCELAVGGFLPGLSVARFVSAH